MMKNNPLFDDMAKMATGAFGSAVEATREAEKWVKGQVEGLLSRMNLVTREEFEVVRAMAAKAREEQDKQQQKYQQQKIYLIKQKLFHYLQTDLPEDTHQTIQHQGESIRRICILEHREKNLILHYRMFCS